MSTIAKRTISLPKAHAAYIDKKVRSGAYASASEVVRDGLRALQERDAAVERWLREDVIKALDAYEANPKSGIPAEKVRREIEARHARAKAGNA